MGATTGGRRKGRLGGLALSAALACGAAAAGGGARGPDAWTGLVAAADRGGGGLSPPGTAHPPLTPRQMYLLAFHEAQDAGDPEHVLAVADRLDAIGEGALARHVRSAAEALLAALDPGSRPAPP